MALVLAPSFLVLIASFFYTFSPFVWFLFCVPYFFRTFAEVKAALGNLKASHHDKTSHHDEVYVRMRAIIKNNKSRS